MRNKKLLLKISLLLIICFACIFNALAHSGRTDANGGHRDNNNKSGLGWYHYHCGGYPAHLHSNGYCPYKTYSSGYSSTSSNDKYDEGYEDGYDEGHDDGCQEGYDEGHSDGYYEGHSDGYDKGYDKGYYDGYDERTIIISISVLVFILAIVVIVLFVKFIKKHRKE